MEPAERPEVVESAQRSEPNKLKVALDEIKNLVAAPVEITITDAQLEQLASKIAAKMLRPMADAAQAAATTLDAAADQG